MRTFIDIITESYHHQTIGQLNVEEFIRGYIEAMLATTDGETGEPLNKTHTSDDIDSVAMDHIVADCRSFLHKAAPWLTVDNYRGPLMGSIEAHAGHDFWMTRMERGAQGFWNGNWETETPGRFADPLTARAHAFGRCDVYVGQDKKIHIA